MNVRLRLLLLLFLLASVGCSQVMVSQDFDKSTVFSNYSSYRWIALSQPPSSDIRTTNPLLHERFRSAIDNALHQKGYFHSEQADFHVGYNYSISTKLQSNSFEPSVGYGYGRFGRYGVVAVRSGTDLYQYDQGMLIVDIYDARNKKLIWRGKGTDIAATHPNPDRVTEQVFKLVAAILKQFPPQP